MQKSLHTKTNKRRNLWLVLGIILLVILVEPFLGDRRSYVPLPVELAINKFWPNVGVFIVASNCDVQLQSDIAQATIIPLRQDKLLALAESHGLQPHLTEHEQPPIIVLSLEDGTSTHLLYLQERSNSWGGAGLTGYSIYSYTIQKGCNYKNRRLLRTAKKIFMMLEIDSDQIKESDFEIIDRGWTIL